MSGSAPKLGLCDTSIFIAQESGRPLGQLPDLSAVSMVTLGELYLGVLMADDSNVRATRLRTLSRVMAEYDALPVDFQVTQAFAELLAWARLKGLRPKPLDTMIAATAAVHDVPLYTQDDGFSAAFPGIDVVKV